MASLLNYLCAIIHNCQSSHHNATRFTYFYCYRFNFIYMIHDTFHISFSMDIIDNFSDMTYFKYFIYQSRLIFSLIGRFYNIVFSFIYFLFQTKLWNWKRNTQSFPLKLFYNKTSNSINAALDILLLIRKGRKTKGRS